MSYMYSFERLNVWGDARKLVALTYQTTTEFPKIEIYGLTNQMRRAAVSIVSNIAEGSGRTSPKDQANFFQIAYSSCLELVCQYCIALDLKYIDQSAMDKASSSIHEVTKKLSGLRNASLKRV